MQSRTTLSRTAYAVAAALLAGYASAPLAWGGVLSEAISVSGDSISRGFNANTGSCNYGDNVSRNWATGDNHGASYCDAGSGGVYSHAERLECNKAGDVVVLNHAESGATLRGDFFNQAAAMRSSLTSSPGPRYALVLLGHNDACTNTLSRTGNGCGGDQNPNNYCRTTNTAFEREFRRGMDQLIQIPSARIGVLATVRVSELCNFRSKDGCGPTFGLNCSSIWGTAGFLEDVFGSGGVCASLTSDCSDQRRIDMYDTLVGYNEILERVSNEYAAIPAGGASANGALKAADVHIRYGDGTFYYKLSSNDLSCCDCFHPSDSGHAKLAEAAWNGLECSVGTPCCADTGNPLADARCDVTDTTSFYAGGFWPGNVACPNGIVEPAEHCDDGNGNDGDCCSSICEYEPSGAPCTSDANVCTTDVCNASGTCLHPANTSPCDDGDECTQTDTCSGGTCYGSDPVVCTPSDACHVAGTCNPATGTCSNPNAGDGTPCDDANACTQTDSCVSGTCVGSSPVTCTPLDQCHVVGMCNPSTGTCSNPNAGNGTPCDDGDACTQNDSCQGGACAGSNPVVCIPADQCHDAGSCNPADGTCSDPPSADGTPCDDANACTQTDTCQSGACVGANPVVCAPLDQCRDAGTCNPADGTCSDPPSADATPCDDGNACTLVDECWGGECAGVSESCGDGVVQAACNEQCDSGAANGNDDCCSLACSTVDTDLDGACDADDPCTGSRPVRRAKLTVARLDTPPGDEAFMFKGDLEMDLPYDPPLDPVANGVRIIVSDAEGVLFDVHVPGGPQWQAKIGKPKWSYSNRADTRPGGISRVSLRASARTPTVMKISMKAADAAIPSTSALPLSAVIVLDPPSAITGQCGFADFFGPPPAASCSMDTRGRRINCR